MATAQQDRPIDISKRPAQYAAAGPHREMRGGGFLPHDCVDVTSAQHPFGSHHPVMRPFGNQAMTPNIPRLLRLPPRSTNPKCPLWQMTNEIYSKILNLDYEQAREACSVDSTTIFKAVALGWSALNPREQMNPILQLLREYDEKIWQTRDKVTRVAIFYKNHRLIKVRCFVGISLSK